MIFVTTAAPGGVRPTTGNAQITEQLVDQMTEALRPTRKIVCSAQCHLVARRQPLSRRWLQLFDFRPSMASSGGVTSALTLAGLSLLVTDGPTKPRRILRKKGLSCIYVL